MTIHDLLTHTAGLGTGGLGTSLQTQAPFPLPSDRTLETEMARYASGALDFQPGSRWSYSGLVGLDVVARIIEIVSGQAFDQFIKERIFEPLDMNNTWFNVPEEYRDRRVVIDGRDMSRFFDNSTNYFSASAGLNSTAEDYLKFEQMLVNDGELFGNRLLSPRSIRMIRREGFTRELAACKMVLGLVTRFMLPRILLQQVLAAALAHLAGWGLLGHERGVIQKKN